MKHKTITNLKLRHIKKMCLFFALYVLYNKKLLYLYQITINTKIMKAIFEIGKKYEMRFIGDSDIKVVFECVKRTDKTATLKSKNEIITKKILFHDDSEYVKYGSYSMAPVIKAKRLVN